MKNKELQALLAKYPPNMPVKILLDSLHYERNEGMKGVHDFTEENILQSSEKAWVDDEAPEDQWDHEDGKVRDKGKKYLLINPIIT